MTIVNTETGEIVEPMSATRARTLTDQVKGALIVAYDVMIACFMGRADLALGYVSWDAYCAGEFDDARMVRLPREQRQEIVTTMRQAGMPTRAIASGLGISKNTAANDSRPSLAGTDEVPTVTSLDGRQRPATKPMSAAQINAITPQAVIDQRNAEADRALPAFGIRMAIDDLLTEPDPTTVVRDCPDHARDQLDRVPEALAYLTALNQAMETYR